MFFGERLRSRGLFEHILQRGKGISHLLDQRAVHIDIDADVFVFGDFPGFLEVAVQAFQSPAGFAANDDRTLADGGPVDLFLFGFGVAALGGGVGGLAAGAEAGSISVKI